MESAYTVYVLHSAEHNKIYIGYAGNLEQRLLSHNKLGTKGWTIKFRPWELIFTKSFENKAAAMQYERQLKGAKGRRWIRENLLPRR